ncbi:hypothetical protein ACXHQ0_15495 [Vibrio antiquarius]|uniref:Uncharacterized protein n=1 Tax=Vibrio parahaemolyticus TaxID=670 RepID=A0AA46Z9F0_VIBPH|nr:MULTISPECIES: hypothetical protein [Vibrio harveyi group]KOE81653.1 hypothetical protein ACS91_21265 [Vibrio parahaemolyticus]MCS0314504.1 hypothetical protein [Vibrio diabolicus]UYV29695.1 hypothetical protein M5598_27335 [Vibrio parahaemolyticus]UYW19263.1 hypothetical protein IF561_28960 [Vibrio parahaemolyticus]
MKKYEDLYFAKPGAFSQVKNEQDYASFYGIIDEKAGGIDVYVHEKIVQGFCCFLAWEKSTMNHHITDTEHEDYDGWQSLGWDTHIFDNMVDSCAMNKCPLSEAQDIALYGVVVAKSVNPKQTERYESLLSEWAETYLK